MSEFSVTVLPLPTFASHPQADTLNIVSVCGYPVIFKKGQFEEGTLVAYVPVDSMVSMADPQFKFLDSGKGRQFERVKAKKIRGIFSAGLLIPAPEGSKPGDDVAGLLDIKKYEEPELPPNMRGESEKDPGFMPKYTSIEHLRKYSHILTSDETVVCSIKIHGSSSRYTFKDGRLWVGSHRELKKENADNLWWKIAYKFNLTERLRPFEGFVFYGEVFGNVQKGFNYGLPKGENSLKFFDVYDINKGHYLDYYDALKVITDTGISPVQEKYCGPWDFEKIKLLAEEPLEGCSHINEGLVVKPIKERWNDETGRTVFKLISENYMVRSSETTEYH